MTVFFLSVVYCPCQVAASVEDQLVSTRTSIAALTAERQQKEQQAALLQDAFRKMLIYRWGGGLFVGQLEACVALYDSCGHTGL